MKVENMTSARGNKLDINELEQVRKNLQQAYFNSVKQQYNRERTSEIAVQLVSIDSILKNIENLDYQHLI